MGDWVLLSTRNLHVATVRKLCQCFVGPFQVLQRVGQTTYKLDLKGRFVGVHDVFHISQLDPMYQVEVQLPLQTLWKSMVKLSMRWSACSGTGLNVEEPDIWLGGLDMVQNMTIGSMKTIWATLRP